MMPAYRYFCHSLLPIVCTLPEAQAYGTNKIKDPTVFSI